MLPLGSASAFITQSATSETQIGANCARPRPENGITAGSSESRASSVM